VTRSRRLPVLFLLALLGVLAMVGLGVAELLGAAAAAAYAVAVLVGLGLLVRRARPEPAPARDHQACSCCDGQPFRGVEVI
jgi:hypothetical protein